MKRKLTDRYLSTLKAPASGRIEVADTEARGLVFRMTSAGAASWAVRYTNPKTRKQSRHTLGDYPALSLAKARDSVTAFRAKLIEGEDPTKKPLETFADLVKAYHEGYLDTQTRKPSQTRALFDQHVLPRIGTMGLRDIRRGDVIDMLDRLQRDGLRSQVNRIQSAVSAALNWAVNEGHIELNPILGLRHRVKEDERDRVLSDAELKAVWMAADGRSVPSRDLVKVLILTMQRRDEVRGMRWDELDETDRSWIIPAARNKSGRKHLVPLSGMAWDLIDAMPRLGPYVFTTDGERAYAGHAKLGPALRRASQVEGWTLHDLRRTGRTGLSRLGVPLHVAELVLNHARPRLEKTYDHYDYLAEKRDALERWAAHVRRTVETPEGANVVAIR